MEFMMLTSFAVVFYFSCKGLKKKDRSWIDHATDIYGVGISAFVFFSFLSR